ncbi:MAG: hypothetical protein ABI747_04320 [Candidatus Moraniibacteriota bacterium]
MGSSQDLKRQHEKAVAEQLLLTLGATGISYDHMGNDVDEPDVLFKQGSKRVGIEVVTAYLDNSHAKHIWQLARGKSKGGGSSGIIENPTEKLRIFIRRRLLRLKKAFIPLSCRVFLMS